VAVAFVRPHAEGDELVDEVGPVLGVGHAGDELPAEVAVVAVPVAVDESFDVEESGGPARGE
jgi:hypothetical protein